MEFKTLCQKNLQAYLAQGKGKKGDQSLLNDRDKVLKQLRKAYYDTPEGMELCLDALKSKSEDLVVDAADTLEEYYANRELSLPQEIIDLLEDQVEKSKHVYAVLACLKLMESTGHITKRESYERLHDWKKRNDYPIF